MQLAGELAKINLPSLIQMVRNGELTGKICLTHGVTTAFMYVDRGRIFHVETDMADGREALLELFLWTGGTFSFADCATDNVAPSLAADEPMDKLVRDGLAYADARKYLDQLRIGPSTVLKLSGSRQPGSDGILSLLDGRSSLKEVAAKSTLPRSELTQALKRVIAAGQAVVAEATPAHGEIKLPDWVVSRLKQDNPDVSRAIVDMVIWVDRIKCWIYQTDADLDRLISVLDPAAEELPAAEEETA